MQTKLTLRMDDKLIAAAKRQAGSQGKSLSLMVADYFRSFAVELAGKKSGAEPGEEAAQPSATPITSSLHGLLKSSNVDEEDYRRYLLDKYR